jgi:cytochrome c-type biogenesis protein CcmH
MAAMTQTYGDFILMQPRKQGFNLLAWFAPFAAIALGAVAIGALLRGWRRNADVAAASRAGAPATLDAALDATPDELARLQAAVREERS